jgi:porin
MQEAEFETTRSTVGRLLVCWRARRLVTIAIAGLLSLLLTSVAARSQEQQLPAQPSSTPVASSSAELKGEPSAHDVGAEATGPVAQQPAADSSRNSDFSDKLTGDWGGARARLQERGITIEGSWIQFFQAVVAGGLERGEEYGGKLTLRSKFDTGKLGLWKNGSFEIMAATRYGRSASPLSGSIFPVNSGLVNPASSGTVTSVIALNYTHIFPLEKSGDWISVSLGKYDVLDLVAGADKFMGGEGLTKFMNLAWNSRPQNGVNIPPVTLGVRTAWVKDGEPFVTFAIFDPQSSQTTSGLKNLFAKGVTLVPGITFRTRFMGKPGHQGFSATFSNQELIPFNQIPLLILPPLSGTAKARRGSWSFTYSADQYLTEGWGLFGQVGVADTSNNAIARFFSFGIAGMSPFEGRTRDSFGIAYAYTIVSSDLKDVTQRLARLRDEQGFEIFYNFAVTPWLQLTGDFQIVKPTRPAADVAVVPGLRLRVDF